MSATIRRRPFTRPDRALLEALAAVATPDLSNVLGSSLVADPALRPVWRGGRLLGGAVTVKLIAEDNLGVLHAVLHAEPGDVLVVEAPAGSTAAICGELIATAAASRGIAGMVIDGAVRDIAALEAMRFPIWARTICARTASKNQDAAVGVPVTCGGCEVQAGDVVLADDDGVVFVSPAKVTAALDAIRAQLAREKSYKEEPGALEQVMRKLISTVRVENG